MTGLGAHIYTKAILTSAILLCFYSVSRSQSLEVLSKSVVFLEHVSIDTFTDKRGTFEVWLKPVTATNLIPKTTSKTGTGVFVGHSRANGQTNFYLLTAKHVAAFMGFTELDRLVTGLHDGRKLYSPLIAYRGPGTNNWVNHTNADVSILPLDPVPELWPFLRQHFLDFETYLAFETNRPSRDVELMVIGFPLGLGTGMEEGEDFALISRTTRVASGLLEGGIFLLQDPGISGYSGAPVFYGRGNFRAPGIISMSGRPTPCIGLVSLTVGDASGGKMAGVVPIKFITELIRQYEAR